MANEPRPVSLSVLDPTRNRHSSIRAECLERLAQGHWRTPIYYEIVTSEIERFNSIEKPTVLDIGCGKGFDGEEQYQRLIAERAGRFIGIEPDGSIQVPNIFTLLFTCSLEQAPIPPSSVHVAFAVMVMEHLADPLVFWNRVRDILVPGGVFLAFTVNGAHWFATLTRVLSAMKVKTRYLNAVYGQRGQERYEDYPVYYRANTGAQIARFAQGFSSLEVAPCGPVGIVAQYAPPILRPAVRGFDSFVHLIRRHPINLIVRAVR